MSATVHHPAAPSAAPNWDFDLGVPGFRYSDLNRVRRLQALDSVFREELAKADPALSSRFEAFRNDGDGPEKTKDASDVIVAVAPHFGRFVARLFKIEPETSALDQYARDEGRLFELKKKFLLPKVLRKAPDAAALAAMDVAALEKAYDAVVATRNPRARLNDPERTLGETGMA
ncbi:MAG TPA: hypothetical protein VHF22_14715, partial [Planctomycetota bacterium]|nr:hypothetical protein [Planctomycetota bacterium]